MDFIINRINKQIETLQFLDTNSPDIKENYKARCEYVFILLLSYLWSKNFDNLSDKNRAFVLSKIEKPPLGILLNIIELLDSNKEVISVEALNTLKKYNLFRIETTGHGFAYSDYYDAYINELNTVYLKLLGQNIILLNTDITFLYPIKINGNLVRGKKFKSDGTIELWESSLLYYNFKDDGNIYGEFTKPTQLKPEYFQVTPFIKLENDNEIYFFKYVEQKLTGTIKYNTLFKTGYPNYDWPEFAKLYQPQSSKIFVCSNKTVVNKFTTNYSQHLYIELGENKRKVNDFLTGINVNSSVCANLWGHGGVGKTATIQKIIEELKASNERFFTHIIFLSNKDRFYNIYKDKNESISNDDRVKSYDELIRSINIVLTDSEEEDYDENRFIDFDNGKLLLVIDDFETFGKEDQIKINQLINKLDPHHHKVIITTRSTIRVGASDISFNELNEVETSDFLLKIFESKNTTSSSLKEIRKELSNPDIRKKLRIVTLGRPIRILQFEYIYNSFGKIENTINHFLVNPSDELNDFFYGRFYNYLTDDAQMVYLTMGVMTYDEDLISVISKVKFTLIWPERNESRFTAAIKELEQQRLIELVDNERYKVWDKDILKGMKESFTERKESAEFNKGEILKRAGQTSSKSDLYESLLNVAKTNKILERSEEEVKSGFKQILNRDDSPLDSKYKALFELANYYRINLGSFDLAFQEFQNYESTFSSYLPFIKTYSLFCYENNKVRKSVDLLEQALLNEKKFNFDNEDRLDILGLLITRKKKYLTDELKKYGQTNVFGKNSIEKPDHLALKKRIKNLVDKEGKQLFSLYTNHRFQDKGKKTNATTGLRHLTDIAVLSKNFDFAEEICNYCIGNFEVHWKKQFEKIQEQINFEKSYKKRGNKPKEKLSDNVSQDSLDALLKAKSKLSGES